MNLNAMDLGVCGVEQLLQAGTIRFDTKDINKGIELMELPENLIITKAVAVVNTSFNAGTTNVLTVGLDESFDDILGDGDITEGTAGSYVKHMFKVCKDKRIKIMAKYTSSGSPATEGEADIYLGVVRIP